jgi:hypothetical protein
LAPKKDKSGFPGIGGDGVRVDFMKSAERVMKQDLKLIKRLGKL